MHLDDIEYNGFKVEIHREEDPCNPLTEFDTACAIVYDKHSRYLLGNEPMDAGDAQELAYKVENTGGIVKSIYAYVHGGSTISMSAFSCPWDSGQSGFVYMTKETIDDEWKGNRKKAFSYMQGVVETFDHYLTGEVYGYIIKDPEGNEIEDGSCWGFYGPYYEEKYKEWIMSECRAVIDYNIKERFPLFA